jgi:hypothetical protein
LTRAETAAVPPWLIERGQGGDSLTASVAAVAAVRGSAGRNADLDPDLDPDIDPDLDLDLDVGPGGSVRAGMRPLSVRRGPMGPGSPRRPGGV